MAVIPFSPPRLDQKTVDAVSEVLLSGWITTGPKTKEFEKQLTEFTGCKKTICLNSATAGLELVARWFGLKEGDEVILPAYTYCATANIVLHCGATPVMVDVDPKDFNVSVERIRENITEKTKIIMPVDVSGWPCDYDEINELVKEKTILEKFQAEHPNQEKLGRILVLSDAAHSIGAYYKGARTGSLTDITVFSFHAVKNLTTAEGGAVCFNLPEAFDCEDVYKAFNIKSLHGQSKDAFSKMQVGNWRYDVIEPGYKCNMMDIQAAIGLVELSRYQETLNRREEIVNRYAEALGKYEWAIIPPFKCPHKESSYHLFLLRIKGASEDQRDQIMQHIFEQEVSVNVHFQPLPLLTVYKSRGFQMDDYPETYAKYCNEISLPVYFDLSDEQVERVINAVIKSVEKVL